MKKQKLTYRFHNPNTEEATIDYLLKVLIEANAGKVERALQAAADRFAEEEACDRGNSGRRVRDICDGR